MFLPPNSVDEKAGVASLRLQLLSPRPRTLLLPSCAALALRAANQMGFLAAWFGRSAYCVCIYRFITFLYKYPLLENFVYYIFFPGSLSKSKAGIGALVAAEEEGGTLLEAIWRTNCEEHDGPGVAPFGT